MSISKTSREWYEYFQINALAKRIDWTLHPTITSSEKQEILPSLQAWQLGETSDGANLIYASTKYAQKTKDLFYPNAVSLFIKEEQKHGDSLGKYLDLIGEKRITKDWGDSLFRKIRYFNTNMEIWTLAVITVESIAQVFYQALKKATHCKLLQSICTDILIDEAAHIIFQKERLETIFLTKNSVLQYPTYLFYKLFFFSTTEVVWFAHKRAFIAGGIDKKKYRKILKVKFRKTLGRIYTASKTSDHYYPSLS